MPAPRLPTALNYRGKRLPARLGVVIASAAIALLGEAAVRHGRLAWIAVGVAAVFLAGLYDDYRPVPVRGMRRQLGALLQGRVTPGIVKLVVISAASLFTAGMLGARGERLVVGAGVMAGSANLWNLLDVRPGRSLKLFVPAAAGLAVGAGSATAATFAGLAAAAAVALVFDLRERAMLGDSGSNVLGFVIGVGISLVLATAWLATVLAAIVVLHVLADTITLSRLIERTPPLRFLDGLGRKKFAVED